MEIHEYQAKELLAGFGVPVPRGGLAYSPEQAAYRARELGGARWYVKAQVHGGGRSLAGGVVACDDEGEVHAAAEGLFGRRLAVSRGGADGRGVYRVYVERAVAVARELYLGLALDRRAERVVVLASGRGGVDIEELAAREPATLIRRVVEPAVGMQAFQAREIAFGLDVDGTLVNAVVDTVLGAYAAFERLDATTVEINPLAIGEDGALHALDVRMSFDDSALFRHPEIAELRDKSQEDPTQTHAIDRGLGYTALDGDIGCIVTGQGIGRATRELIEQRGGRLANVLDIGGGASPERVVKALRLVLADARVRTVLVNAFCGINRCDHVAEGLVRAYSASEREVPLIVRLAGARLAEGRRALVASGLPLIRAATLTEAVERAVRAASSGARRASSAAGTDTDAR